MLANFISSCMCVLEEEVSDFQKVLFAFKQRILKGCMLVMMLRAGLTCCTPFLIQLFTTDELLMIGRKKSTKLIGEKLRTGLKA